MAASQGVILLTNASTTGQWFNWPGGRAQFTASASNWNGATVELDIMGPAGSAISSGASLTANGYAIADLAPGELRATISGGPPTAVYATLSRIVE